MTTRTVDRHNPPAVAWPHWWRIRGRIEAEDSTAYEPAYYGPETTARRLFAVLASEAAARGDRYELALEAETAPGEWTLFLRYEQEANR